MLTDNFAVKVKSFDKSFRSNGYIYTVKLGNKERFDKEQIGKSPFEIK